LFNPVPVPSEIRWTKNEKIFMLNFFVFRYLVNSYGMKITR
jgi:hypothetical protein